MEILRQFEKCDGEEDFKLLRKLLSKFWMDRAVEEADKAAKERGYTAEIYEQFRHEHN